MPQGTGYLGDGAHDKEVKRIEELENYYRQHLSPRFQEMVEDWALYLAVHKETRRDKEKKWRANVRVPYPYSMVETIAATMTDIMGSPDPAIQVEGIGGEDQDFARGLETLFDNTLRANKWQLQKAMAFRSNPIQGTEVFKLGWREVRRNLYLRPKAEDYAFFEQAVQAAVKAGAGMAPEDPQEFERWRMDVNLVKKFGDIPAAPISGWKSMREYAGPWLERVPIFDLRFSPNRDPLSPLPIIIQRIVVSKKWLMSMSGPEAWKPYDLEQVTRCLGGWDGKLWEQWQDQINEMMGIKQRVLDDPYHDDSAELWEAWEPDAELPFKIILNRKAIINKKPNELLYAHGQGPYHFIRNIPVAHQYLGMSEYQQSRRLFAEMDTMRSLRLDAVVLQVLPIFMKLKDQGMTDVMKQIRPGMVVDVPSANSIKQLLEFHTNINDAFREVSEIKADIDETAATQPQVRGSTASVGRVSATEIQQRLNQALVRTKDRVVRVEEELSDIPKQALMLWYQFGDPQMVIKASGDRGAQGYNIPRDRFLDALQYDVRFRGASKVLNKDMAAQQLKDAIMTIGNMKLGTLKEMRKLIVRWLETMGQKGVYDLITDAGTAEIEQAQQMAAQQAQAEAMAKAGGKPGAPGPEGAPEGAGGGEGLPPIPPPPAQE